MALTSGTRVGPYEVVAPLGAGGMGEVYRARDTKLGRDVAVKVLPAAFAHDRERVARFQREAQLLASLNHPHIATIHGLEETDDGQFLVMELIEGGTLADLLQRGAGPSGPAGLELDEALTIARQVAEALQAAHEKGIVHRDLKPANIAFTATKQVKVLDFGLAKAIEMTEGPASMTHSPTLSVAATQAGTILGTAAYMAPEQARGKAADKRCDIWAFGCVLYEALTGKRAFTGVDVADTLAAVLRSEPDWRALPPSVPAPVRSLVRACLEKDRQVRVADIAVALFVLDEAGREAREDRGTEVGRNRPSRPLWRRRAAFVGVAMTAAILGGGAVWFASRPSSVPPTIVRTEITGAGASALSVHGLSRDLAITPDGTRVIYRGQNQLLVRALDQFSPTALVSGAGPEDLCVSPDSQWVGIMGNKGPQRIPINGGSPVTLAFTGVTGTPRGNTCGEDGTVIFATAAVDTGLWRVSEEGREVKVSMLTRPDPQRGELDHVWPHFLPGGQAVLFTITTTTGGLDNTHVAVLDLRTNTSTVVLRGGSDARYVPSGHLVYGSRGTLHAVAFDLARLAVVGTPVPVVEQVLQTPVGAMDAAVSSNGTLVYVPSGVGGAARSLVWVDRTGREEPLGTPVRSYEYPRVSPDGTRIAVNVRDDEQDIWTWDLVRRTFTRLTFHPAADIYPVWWPDGRHVLFASQRAGAYNLYRQAADGTGAVERLSESTNPQFPYVVTRPGTEVILRETRANQDLMLLPLGSKGAARPLLATMYFEGNAELSPDGRWLAYDSNESGRQEIYVRPFPDVDRARWQVSTAGGRSPLWSPDGRELFYVSADDRLLMGTRVEPGASWSSGTPAPILRGQYFFARAGLGRTFDITPDGRRFLMIKEGSTDEASTAPRIVVVQNFFEELKRLVPVN